MSILLIARAFQIVVRRTHVYVRFLFGDCVMFAIRLELLRTLPMFPILVRRLATVRAMLVRRLAAVRAILKFIGCVCTPFVPVSFRANV